MYGNISVTGGPLLDSQIKALIQRVREVLESDRSVAVVGWISRNHSEFTRRLPEKRVVFHDSSPASLGRNVGLVLLTPYLDHKVAHRLRKKKPTCPIVIEIRQIREILEACSDILLTPVTPVVNGMPDDSTPRTPAAFELEEEVLELLTRPTPQPRREEMSEHDAAMAGFAKDFLGVAKEDPEGHVTKNVLGRLKQSHGIDMVSAQLVRDGWIQGGVTEGSKNVGWYTAGPRMLEVAKPELAPPPTTPYEWAEWRAAQRPTMEAKKAALEAELAKVIAELEEIATAERAIEQLTALMPPKA